MGNHQQEGWSRVAATALAGLAVAVCGCYRNNPTDAGPGPEVAPPPASAKGQHKGASSPGAAPNPEQIPSSFPILESRDEPPHRAVTLLGSGDVLIHRRVVASAEAHEGGFEYVLASLGNTLSEPHASEDGPRERLTLINLETPLTEAYISPYNALPPVLGAPPELGPVLARLGVDVVNVANNHAFDQTADGLADTLRTARAAGLAVVGAGPDEAAAFRPRVLERGGLKIAVLGLAQYVNQRPGERAKNRMVVAKLRTPEPMLSAISRASQEADVVVVAAHWSGDFMPGPTKRQRRWAQGMIDAGADVIFGTGPHVLHGVERVPSPRGQAVVAYSLGNLISNQGLRYKVGHRPRRDEHPVVITAGTRDAVVLGIDLHSPEPGRIEITGIKAHCLWTRNNHFRRIRGQDENVDIHLIRLKDASPEVRDERLKAIAKALGPEVELIP